MFNVPRYFAAKRSTVEVHEDRLRITIGAQVREAMLEDIREIKLSGKLSAFYVFLIILLLVGSLAKPWLILLALVDLWAGLHTRITILKGNGEEIILHSIRKKATEDFQLQESNGKFTLKRTDKIENVRKTKEETEKWQKEKIQQNSVYRHI